MILRKAVSDIARYIDADKLCKAVLASWDKDNHKTIEASRVHRQEHHHLMSIIEKQPIADVVPKSEVDKLEYILTGVMHSVDKWLDGEELKQDEVNRAITMREKTLRIIEDAKSEIERLEKDNKKLTINMNAFGLTAIRQKEEKDALAREIFEEIDNKLHDMAVEYHKAGHPEYFAVCEMVHHKVIRPVEKEYTESEDKE